MIEPDCGCKERIRAQIREQVFASVIAEGGTTDVISLDSVVFADLPPGGSATGTWDGDAVVVVLDWQSN